MFMALSLSLQVYGMPRQLAQPPAAAASAGDTIDLPITSMIAFRHHGRRRERIRYELRSANTGAAPPAGARRGPAAHRPRRRHSIGASPSKHARYEALAASLRSMLPRDVRTRTGFEILLARGHADAFPSLGLRAMNTSRRRCHVQNKSHHR